MMTLRKAADRFHTAIDWLDSWHTFSFGSHYDQRHMGFGPLRVINDDRIKGGGGFPTHGHKDMEIITIVLSGALAHKDSIGTGSVIRPGDVQKMSAGSGIQHSEFNASPSEPVHLLQIWIMPNKAVEPEYQQIHFEAQALRNQFCLVAAEGKTKSVITLYQDAKLYIADVSAGESLNYKIAPSRHVWVQMATGKVLAGSSLMAEGDGLAVEDEASLTFTAQTESKILLFDLGN